MNERNEQKAKSKAIIEDAKEKLEATEAEQQNIAAQGREKHEQLNAQIQEVCLAISTMHSKFALALTKYIKNLLHDLSLRNTIAC